MRGGRKSTGFGFIDGPPMEDDEAMNVKLRGLKALGGQSRRRRLRYGLLVSGFHTALARGLPERAPLLRREPASDWGRFEDHRGLDLAGPPVDSAASPKGWRPPSSSADSERWGATWFGAPRLRSALKPRDSSVSPERNRGSLTRLSDPYRSPREYDRTGLVDRQQDSEAFICLQIVERPRTWVPCRAWKASSTP